MAILRTVAEETSSSAARFLTGPAGPVANPSPFLTHWAYQAAGICSQLVPEMDGDDGQLAPLGNLVTKLKILQSRWMAASMFTILLPVRDVIYKVLEAKIFIFF